jgi:metal-responsive CopG/Arc/MetJ family transcriptional regulator
MASAKGKVVVSAEVPTELKDELDKRAGAEGRSRSELVSRAVRFYLKHAPVVRADDVPEPKVAKDARKTDR